MAGQTIGRPQNRVDGPLKVTGRADYGADFTYAGLVHGYVVTSTIANGTIRSMDTAAAERSPGVLAVHTPFNAFTIHAVPGLRAPVQDTTVSYHGQAIGLVVAETFEQARAAAFAITVDYERRAPAISLDEESGNARPIPPVMGIPPVVTMLADGVSSIEEALRDSRVTVSGTYVTAAQAHTAMEPYSAVVTWDDGRFTVHNGTQGVGTQAALLGQALGVDATDIHGVNPYVGGSFGGKYRPNAEVQLAAGAARALRRPVKLVLTREQSFTGTVIRPATQQEVSLGATPDGILTAIRHHALAGGLANGATAEMSAQRTSLSWYAVPNLDVRQTSVLLNTPDPTIMRAPGEATGSFALESAMDELALALRMDPVELRIRNNATVHPYSKLPFSSKHLVECYREGAHRFGWARRATRPRSVVDGEWYVGMGAATSVYPGFRNRATVKVGLRADGTALVSCDTADLGTGMWTVLPVVAAESLGLPVRRIEPRLGDSDLSSTGSVGGSCGVVTVGPAIMEAARNAVAALLELATDEPGSPFQGTDVADLRYDSGRVVGPRFAMDFDDLLEAVGRSRVEALGTTVPGDEAEHYVFDSFGAQFVEARVNRWTGEIRVSRALGVMDAGRIVNPKTARSQIMGGMIWGISAALHEGLHMDDSGHFVNGDLANYLVPVNADVPEVDVHFLDYPDTRYNPLGSRGIGELGVVGTAAAVANAVHNATGIRLRELPIALEHVLAGLD
ncbi:xanthine dehydrogenase family protein molybdopterin-binding subunit [Streptomyces sp. NPDC059863]|uniref:xanthine dehydrogenase family protein molybdopterin-binding subunit n=1 Tax=unclassified Streptomyces TaxID=2593676 RepID=UPI00364D2C4A